MITFADFYQRVLNIAAPENVGENQVNLFRSGVVNGLIAVQTQVPCYRDFHVDFVTKSFVRDFCNTDIFTGPRGTILQVYAYKPGKDCQKYFYTRKSTEFIQCWIDETRCVSCATTDTANHSHFLYTSPYCNYPIPGTEGCLPPYLNGVEDDTWFKNGWVSSSTNCLSCMDAAGDRYFAVGPDYQVFLAPRFPCGYVVAVQWEGIKRTWSNADPCFEDDDFVLAVAKYAEAELAAKDRQWADVSGLKSTFTDLTRGMAQRCRRERRLTPVRDCSSLVDHLLPLVNPTPDSVSLDIYGDGTPGADTPPLAPSPNLTALWTGNTLWVDKVWGNDTLALREREDRPFLTITAAKNAARSGDHVIVRAGTYPENNLWKNGLHYTFEPGSVIDYREPGYISTSNSTVLIGLGAKTFTVSAGLPLAAGDLISVHIAPNTIDPAGGGREPTNYYMQGTVSSYGGTTLVINSTLVAPGAGTYSHWIVFRIGLGIFDDRAAATPGTLKVSGDLEIVYRNSNPLNLLSHGAICQENIDSTLFYKGVKVSIGEAGFFGNSDFAAFHIKRTSLTVIDVDQVVDTAELWPELDGDPDAEVLWQSDAAAFYWGTGETHIQCRRSNMVAGYPLWCDEPVEGANSNLYYNGDLMHTGSITSFYASTYSRNYRAWVDCKLIESAAGASLDLSGPARIYVNAQKLLGPVGNQCELWLTVEKITSATNWISHKPYNSLLIGAGSLDAHITCQHGEESGGSITNGINNTSAATLFIHGGYFKTGAASQGLLTHTGVGGHTKLIGVTLDNTANNSAANKLITVSTAGLQLQNCVLLAPAASDSIYAAAGPVNVRLHGYNVATKAAHVNIALQPGAGYLIVDANAAS